jgi:N-methylhydantoinase B/oxoprolinase/acetone carboxylase alpha subunit
MGIERYPEPLELAPEGYNGGLPGDKGHFLINGEATLEARKITMEPSDEVLMMTPGGGGMGAPA